MINSKVKFLAIAIATVGLIHLNSSPSSAAQQCNILYAGQTTNVGTICVDNDLSNLSVTYTTIDAWTLEETHLFVGSSLTEVPRTQTGNPKIGLFPFGADSLAAGTTTSTITIPLGDFGAGGTPCLAKDLIVAAHAVVVKVNSDGSIRRETAWGNGSRFATKGSWATYFTYRTQCPSASPVACTGANQTAYALGQTTFIELGLTNSRWGWQLTVPVGSATAQVYAGAAQNDITKGTNVGTLQYQYTGSHLILNFMLNAGWLMTQTHVFAGSNDVITIAPGQYGHQHNLQFATSDSYSIPINGDPIYVVFHAVVCKQ
ncbi:MAG: hypothetical protein RL042_2291 [Nitrospirota bacterium]